MEGTNEQQQNGETQQQGDATQQATTDAAPAADESLVEKIEGEVLHAGHAVLDELTAELQKLGFTIGSYAHELIQKVRETL